MQDITTSVAELKRLEERRTRTADAEKPPKELIPRGVRACSCTLPAPRNPASAAPPWIAASPSRVAADPRAGWRAGDRAVGAVGPAAGREGRAVAVIPVRQLHPPLPTACAPTCSTVLHTLDSSCLSDWASPEVLCLEACVKHGTC